VRIRAWRCMRMVNLLEPCGRSTDEPWRIYCRKPIDGNLDCLSTNWLSEPDWGRSPASNIEVDIIAI
jgi:hypothetical protein